VKSLAFDSRQSKGQLASLMPQQRAPALAAGARRPTALAAGGSSSAAAPLARTPGAGEQSLEGVNASLRRELQACREELAAAVFGPIPGAPRASDPLSPAWAAAQLAQSRRQVQLLSEALATRSDVTVELEAVLLQLRQPAADGTRSEAAVWAGSALKRIRGVQWVEAISQDVVDRVSALSVIGRSGLGAPPPPASQRAISIPTASQRGLVSAGAAAPLGFGRAPSVSSGGAVGRGGAPRERES